MPCGQDAELRRERVDGTSGGVASARRTAASIAPRSATMMRCPASWPSGTAFSAADVWFSTQPNAYAASTASALAACAAAAYANAVGSAIGDIAASVARRAASPQSSDAHSCASDQPICSVSRRSSADSRLATNHAFSATSACVSCACQRASWCERNGSSPCASTSVRPLAIQSRAESASWIRFASSAASRPCE
ncbi:hypothetical protein WT26_07690 [Burkholderia cepacia]|uniref:Uncharacterized protein n=1 Tax=Burkholderia cepacia TaxID=292 RepID=A0A1B4PPQ1_BURCE|nr:hypothetical protein WT26_07690 [Burkholderia cepacia]